MEGFEGDGTRRELSPGEVGRIDQKAAAKSADITRVPGTEYALDQMFELARERRLILAQEGRPGLHENARAMVGLAMQIPSGARVLTMIRLVRMLELASHEMATLNRKGKGPR